MSSFHETAGIYQCGICKRNYKRIDHLSRHARSHTQSRPHKCHICPKSFTRTDLLKRHLAAHEKHSAKADLEAPVLSHEDGPPLGRVAIACESCSENHLRCTNVKPCKRCRGKNIECIWDSIDMQLVFTPPMTDCERSQHDGSLPPAATRLDSQLALEEAPLQAGRGVQVEVSATTSGLEGSAAMQENGFVLDPALVTTQLPLFDGFSVNLLSADWMNLEDGLELDTNLFGDPEDMNSLGLDDQHITSFAMGTLGQRGSGQLSATSPPYERPSRRLSDPGQPAAMCTEAFRNSPWHFHPETKDNVGANNRNLLLPQDSDFDSPGSRMLMSLENLPHNKRLKATTRDKILAMVVKNAVPDHLSKAILSFPSTQVLDTLIRHYLNSPVSRATSFIHVPTFDPNDRRPELLAAMAAHGAVLTSNTALTKVGLAVAEITRIAIFSLVDSDNAVARDLQFLQAFYIVLETGLWSGHGRHVEITESMTQTLVTMMRRAGKFRRASYSQPALGTSQHTPEKAREKWLAWVENESYKRLAFRLLQHDTDSSMSLLVNPVLSYVEVELPLPDSAALWSAATADQWTRSFPSRSNRQNITAGGLINDPDALTRHADIIDGEVASRSVLSLGWMLTWEYTRMASFQKLQPRQFNALIAKLRLDELRKLLGSLAVSLSSDMRASPDLAVRLELIHLHLYMPFEDIQTFAGMQGAYQARAVYPAIREWVLSESARRAVYHAAQVIRASRYLSQGLIQGPEAIMVYYASLALWVYGLLVEKQPARGEVSSAAGIDADKVHLDKSEESIGLRRFIELGIGRPCIHDCRENERHSTHEASVVYLDRPDASLGAIIAVVKDNFRTKEMAYLTQKLIQLMEALRKAATPLVTNAMKG